MSLIRSVRAMDELREFVVGFDFEEEAWDVRGLEPY